MFLCMTDLTALTATVAEMREQLNTQNVKIQLLEADVKSVWKPMNCMIHGGDMPPGLERMIDDKILTLKKKMEQMMHEDGIASSHAFNLLQNQITEIKSTVRAKNNAQNELYVHPIV
jgi:hypothetical protein